jgi:hypothetical protein
MMVEIRERERDSSFLIEMTHDDVDVAVRDIYYLPTTANYYYSILL